MMSVWLTGRKRKALDEHGSRSGSTKRFKQQTLTGSFDNANLVTQASVDEAILNLVVGAVLPLHTVEVQEFVDLIKMLQPNRDVLCHKTLRARIAESASENKRKLVSLMKGLDCVATTTDCWSAYGKAFIGVTVHWIDSGTLQRSACLALRRMTGRHTYDLIASTLENIHVEFGRR